MTDHIDKYKLSQHYESPTLGATRDMEAMEIKFEAAL